MARSTKVIYDSLIVIKEGDQNLDELNSTSSTALWSLFLYIVAAGISFFEQIQDVFMADLIYQKSTTSVYTPQWWVDRMVNFYQFSNTDPNVGIVQVNDNFNVFYNTVDENAKIVDFCSTTQTPGNRQVTIKVAKDDGNGNPAVLTNDELLSASSFVERVKSAGLLISTVSFPADQLFFDLDIYFDGQYVQSTTQDNVNNGIISYLESLPFDGSVRLSSVVDAIQQIEGIVDVQIKKAEIQPDGQTAPSSFDRIAYTKAGYANYNPANSVVNMIIE
tara:strand:- start:1416 stop:2243 length:828 start_codon:yes stop_codon:yes gene_type:complete